MGDERVKSGIQLAREATMRRAQSQSRQTGTLPGQRPQNRQTGALPEQRVQNRQTGTLPEQRLQNRQTGTLPEMGQRNRQTDTLPNANQQQDLAEGQKPRRNVVGDDHIYTIPRGTLLVGNKAKLVVDRGLWNSQYVEMYLVRGKQYSYVAKVYYEWAPENKYRDEIITFLEKKQLGIIPLLDYGLYEGRDFYIFPYYEKKSLDENKPEFDDVRLTRFVKVLNEALHRIHSAGFLHADIKPANILYDDKRDIPVITDFGSMTTLKKDAQMKVQRSITNAAGKVSEGYLAPYALNYGAAKGEQVLDLGIKTDYFALGVSLCEMFVRKPFYKMFRDNAEIATCLNTGSIPYHHEVEENARLYNLVQALLAESPNLCPGYKEVNDWVNGSTLEIVHKVETKAGFSHYFKRKVYTDPKELAEAYVGENWKDCINDLFRKETLYDTYKKYDESIYSDIIDIREDNQSEDTKAASAFQIVCRMHPGIRFFWDGKHYNHDDQTEADHELAADIYKSVDEGDHKFDTLFSTRALRTYFLMNEGRKSFLPEIDRILAISEYAMERAQLIFAETISPGILTSMLTWDKIHDFRLYLKAVHKDAQQGGFDKAVEYNLGNTSGKNMLSILQEKAYESEVINALLCCNGHEEEIILHEEKTERVFQPLIRLLLMMGKIFGYENMLPVIRKSAAYQAIVKCVQISDQFDYIDEEPNQKRDAEPICEEFERYRTIFAEIDKSPAAELRVYLNLLDDVLETLGEIGDDSDAKPPVIYEKTLRESGLLIARKSYICPRNNEVMCRINDKYVLPETVAGYLAGKGFDIKIKKLEERKKLLQGSLQMTKQKVENFFQNFKSATGTENMREEALQAHWIYILNVLLPIFAILFSGGLLRCGYKFWVNHERNVELTGWQYPAAVACVCGFIALPGIVRGLLRLIRAVKNYKNYLDNKNLIDHYMALKKTQEELVKFSNTGEIGKLSQKSSQTIQDIKKMPDIEEYKGNYKIKQGYVELSPSKLHSSVIKIIFCGVALAFISLPVSDLTGCLIRNDFTTAQQVANTKIANSASRKINQLYSALVLKLTENKNASWLIDHYNDDEMTYEDYNRQTEQYINIFELYDEKMSEKNSEVLRILPMSKQAYQKGCLYLNKEKLQRAAIEFAKVIEADNNYEDVRDWLNDYYDILLQKQQSYVDSGDEENIQKAINKYKKLIENGAANSDLQSCYEYLTNYNGDERFLRMIARQLTKSAENWGNVVEIGCVKKSDGLYYVERKTAPKEDLISSLFGEGDSYNYESYNTYTHEQDDAAAEQEYSMTEYNKDWSEDDFYYFLLQNAGNY